METPKCTPEELSAPLYVETEERFIPHADAQRRFTDLAKRKQRAQAQANHDISLLLHAIKVRIEGRGPTGAPSDFERYLFNKHGHACPKGGQE